MRKNLLLEAILITLILCFTLTSVGGVPPTATIAVEPTWNFEPASTEFTINLTVADAEDIQSWEANVTFDPAILEFVRCAEGEFLKRKGIPTDFLYDNRTDRVLLSAAYLAIGPPGVGVTGDGQLANITFRVNATGAASIHLDEEYTTLTYNDGGGPALQPCVLRDGFFTIIGDLNCNGDVEASDLYTLARAYGTEVGDPSYYWLADLDSNDYVDIGDLNIFDEKYGESVKL